MFVKAKWQSNGTNRRIISVTSPSPLPPPHCDGEGEALHERWGWGQNWCIHLTAQHAPTLGWSLLLISLVILITACGNTSTEQQTLNAYDEDFANRMSDLRTTATVQIERLLVTVERAQTDAVRATQEMGFMVSTLQARGTETIDLPGVVTLQPTPDSQQVDNFGNRATPIGQGNLQVTPFSPTPDPTALAQVTSVSDIVLSSAVGNDDCATAITNEFTPTTPEIYIVGTANFEEETTVSTQWLRGDSQVAQFSFTYGTVDGNCIWFFVDQSDFEFTPGNYMVIMEVNGIPLAPVPFLIVGDTTLEQMPMDDDMP